MLIRIVTLFLLIGMPILSTSAIDEISTPRTVAAKASADNGTQASGTVAPVNSQSQSNTVQSGGQTVTAQIPEPSTYLVMGGLLSIVGLWVYRRKKRMLKNN
jgi:hypothetical protein